MAYTVHGFSTDGPTVQGSESAPVLQTSTRTQVTDVSADNGTSLNGAMTLKHTVGLVLVATVAIMILRAKVGA